MGLIVLLFFGPQKLPALGKALGTGIRDFKKGLSGVDDEVTKTEAPVQKHELKVTHELPGSQNKTAQQERVEKVVRHDEGES